MKKSFLPAIALFVSIFAASCLWPSGAYAAGGKPPKAQVVETYMVIKIVDENKDETKGEKKIEYKAIGASQFKDEEKRAKDEYTRRMKEWHDLKKTNPSAAAPKRILVKKIPKLTGYETQNIAQDEAKKLTDEEEKKEKDAAGGNPAPVKN